MGVFPSPLGQTQLASWDHLRSTRITHHIITTHWPLPPYSRKCLYGSNAPSQACLRWSTKRDEPESQLKPANGAVDLLSLVFQAFILPAPMFGRIHKHLDNKQQQPLPIKTAAATVVIFTSGGFCPQDDSTVSIFTKSHLVTRVGIKKWLWRWLIEAPLK